MGLKNPLLIDMSKQVDPACIRRDELRGVNNHVDSLKAIPDVDTIADASGALSVNGLSTQQTYLIIDMDVRSSWS